MLPSTGGEKSDFSFFKIMLFSPKTCVDYKPLRKSFLVNTLGCFGVVITVINMEAEKSIVLCLREVPTGTLDLNILLEVFSILESFFKM